jgi:hypothetical protein
VRDEGESQQPDDGRPDEDDTAVENARSESQQTTDATTAVGSSGGQQTGQIEQTQQAGSEGDTSTDEQDITDGQAGADEQAGSEGQADAEEGENEEPHHYSYIRDHCPKCDDEGDLQLRGHQFFAVGRLSADVACEECGYQGHAIYRLTDLEDKNRDNESAVRNEELQPRYVIY